MKLKKRVRRLERLVDELVAERQHATYVRRVVLEAARDRFQTVAARLRAGHDKTTIAIPAATVTPESRGAAEVAAEPIKGLPEG